MEIKWNSPSCGHGNGIAILHLGALYSTKLEEPGEAGSFDESPMNSAEAVVPGQPS